MQKTDNIKLILLGESQAGKSSLVLQFVKEQNKDFQESTIGYALFAKSIILNERVVKFEIWNCAGHERYKSSTRMYYKGAKAALVVYDIARKDTFERAKSWVKELRGAASPEIVIALAGNYPDSNSNRTVAHEEAHAYAEENGIVFKETSDDNGINVDELFLEIAQKVLLKSDASKSTDTNTNDGKRSRAEHNDLQEENKNCCYLL